MAVSPGYLRLPSSLLNVTGWRPKLWTVPYSLLHLRASSLDTNFDDGGYPTQTTAGTSSGNGWTATVDTADLSQFVYTGTDYYAIRMETSTTKHPRLYASILPGAVNFVTTRRRIRCKFRLLSANVSNNGAIRIGWLNTANPNNVGSAGLLAIYNGTTVDAYSWVFSDAGALSYVSIGAASLALDTDYWLYVEIGGDMICTIYTDEYMTRLLANNAGGFLVTAATTVNAAGVCNYNGAASGRMDARIDDFQETDSDAIEVVTTQPVITCQELDTGTADSTHDISTCFLDEETNIQLRHTASNTTPVTPTGSFVTPANLRAESDRTGRYGLLEIRPAVSDGATQVWATAGRIDVSVPVATAPAAPTITAWSVASGSITITVDGDAGVTNEMFYRAGGAGVPVSGGTRVGDGDITRTGLTNGTVYEVFAQSSTGGVYGPASAPIYVVPNAGSGLPTQRVSAWLYEVRQLMLNSAQLLAWIQSVNAAQTTAGHVLMGYDPRTNPDEQTLGPVVYVRPENYISENAFSEQTYRDSFDVVIHFAYYVNPLVPADWIAHLNYFYGIVAEIKAIGTDLSSTYRGEVYMLATDDFVTQDEFDRRERHSEIRLKIRTGS